MAAEETLKVVLEVEANNALKPLKDFDAAVSSVHNGTKQTSKTIDQLGQSFKTAKTPIDATSQSLKNLKTSTGGASSTLVNFGRVVQDAPFGLIGIANNIDPLISSFQRLRQESGSSKAAFKSLLAGLAGPTGIAIAVSAVTSALIAFGPQIKEFFGTVDIAGQKAKKAAENFTESANQVAGEASKVETLVAVLRSDITAREQKAAAIKELNRINPQYFSGLKLEGDLVTGLDAGYKSYIANLLATAKAKAQQTALTDLYTKRLELENKLIGDDLASANAKAAQATNDLNKARGNVRPLGIGPVLTKDEQAALSLQNQIAALDREIAATAQKTIPAFTKAYTEKTKAVKEDVAESFISFSLTERLTRQTDSLTKAINNYRASLKKKNEEEKVSALVDTVDSNQLAPLDLGSRLKLPAGITEQIKKFNDSLKETQIRAENIQTAFSLVTPLIDQAFNALANGQNAFDALIQGVKRLIVELVKAAAIAAVLSIVTGGGGGFATSFLKNFKGLLGFRANGGPIGQGQPFIVGERGPELFVPNTSGSIVSNTNLRSDGIGELIARISGNDLQIILDRANRQRGRLG